MKKTAAEKKIQWHPAFCSAVRLELAENKAELDYTNEYNLSSKPLQIDLLVIRKSKDVLISNEIGRLFKGHNIMEYKSPEDSMNVDTYFKVLAYACLYKANEQNADTINTEDITISLVREGYPRKLMHYFQQKNYTITMPYSGIYYIKKDGFFDTQLIVSRELTGDAHIWLKSLTENLPRTDAESLVLHLNALNSKADKNYGDSVLQVAISANPRQFDLIRKEGNPMCQALLDLFKPEVDALLAQAQTAAQTEERRKISELIVKNIENISKNLNLTIEKACQALGYALEDYQNAKDVLAQPKS